MNLRPYQNDIITELKPYLGSDKALLVSWATGVGKGVLFAALYKELDIAPKRILILTHLDILARQAYEKLNRWNPGIPIGLEMADSFAGDAPIVVGSVPTLGRRDSTRLGNFNPKEFSVIVADECHIIPSPSYKKILEYFGVIGPARSCRPLLLGLTATPHRHDGKSLTDYFDEQLSEYQIAAAINDGWLSDLVGIKISTNVDLSKIKVRAGDLDPAMLEKAVNIKIRNKLVVDNWAKYAKGLSTVVFCASIYHGKSVV